MIGSGIPYRFDLTKLELPRQMPVGDRLPRIMIARAGASHGTGLYRFDLGGRSAAEIGCGIGCDRGQLDGWKFVQIRRFFLEKK
jgi:hypothetical protein